MWTLRATVDWRRIWRVGGIEHWCRMRIRTRRRGTKKKNIRGILTYLLEVLCQREKSLKVPSSRLLKLCCADEGIVVSLLPKPPCAEEMMTLALRMLSPLAWGSGRLLRRGGVFGDDIYDNDGRFELGYGWGGCITYGK